MVISFAEVAAHCKKEVMTQQTPTRRITVLQGFVLSALAAFGFFLIFLVVTGAAWRAVAYAMAALFAFLGVLAVYFWGALLLGGFLEMFGRQHTPAPWSIGDVETAEHDLDPGLELQAAGILVYRLGEVLPRVHFRKVPLAEVRAVRPFVVVRTGAARAHTFEFSVTDEHGIHRLDSTLVSEVQDTPQLIMPSCLLRLDSPRRLVGQRWRLRVRSGVTTITSLGFMFVEGTAPSNGLPGGNGQDPVLAEQYAFLPRLLDEAIKRDAMEKPSERMLEGL
jgi:hypothetical protein